MTDGKEIQLNTESKSPAEMIQSAVQSGANLEQLEKLLTLQERWEANQAKKEFNRNMVEVHKEMPIVGKTLKNNQTNSKYASLDAIIIKTKAVYTAHGFSITFYEGETTKAEHIRICADVVHADGHKETYFYDVPMDGKGIKGNVNMTPIHAKASSTSYAQRYLMCMIWNIPTGDDNDAQTACTEYITDQQVADLEALIDELNANKPQFLAYMKIESLDKMPKTSYKKAVLGLEIKRKGQK